jgi:hypothetical protein
MTNLIEALAQKVFGTVIPQTTDAIKDTLSAIEVAGYRVVPVQPTKAMLDAAAIVVDDDHDRREPHRFYSAPELYAAMLAAAPKVSE